MRFVIFIAGLAAATLCALPSACCPYLCTMVSVACVVAKACLAFARALSPNQTEDPLAVVKVQCKATPCVLFHVTLLASMVAGFEVMSRFLAGAHSIDSHFTSAPLLANLPVLLGLLGVWNSTCVVFLRDNFQGRLVLLHVVVSISPLPSVFFSNVCFSCRFLGYGSRALLPYSQALLRLPAHIQQVRFYANLCSIYYLRLLGA